MSRLDSLQTHDVPIEETRDNLPATLPLKKLSAVFREYFGENNGVDLVLPKHDIGELIDFK